VGVLLIGPGTVPATIGGDDVFIVEPPFLQEYYRFLQQLRTTYWDYGRDGEGGRPGERGDRALPPRWVRDGRSPSADGPEASARV
jgi:hypothetical protein